MRRFAESGRFRSANSVPVARAGPINWSSIARLLRDGASFETRPAGAPQDDGILLMAIRTSPSWGAREAGVSKDAKRLTGRWREPKPGAGRKRRTKLNDPARPASRAC